MENKKISEITKKKTILKTVSILGNTERILGILIGIGGSISVIKDWPKNDSTGIGTLFSLVILIGCVTIGILIYLIGIGTVKRDRIARWGNIILAFILLLSIPAYLKIDFYTIIIALITISVLILMFLPSVKIQFANSPVEYSDGNSTLDENAGKTTEIKELSNIAPKRIRHPFNLLTSSLLLIFISLYWIIPLFNASNWFNLGRKRSGYVSMVWSAAGFSLIFLIKSFDDLSYYLFGFYDFGILFFYAVCLLFCLFWYFFDAHRIQLYIKKNDIAFFYSPLNYKRHLIVKIVIFAILTYLYLSMFFM